MFIFKPNTVDLSTKYGEMGKFIFEIIKKYDNIELNTTDEQQKLLTDMKIIINNDSIDFDDKILIVSSLVNNSQTIKKLF